MAAGIVESLVLGLLSFVIIEMVSLIYYSMFIAEKNYEHNEFMKNVTEYSIKLHDMNSSFYEICRDSHGENDLFVTYAKKELDVLYTTLRRAANQKEFTISSDYMINVSGVFVAFSQTTDKTLKMTFPIFSSDVAVFTSSAESHFFEVLHQMVERSEVDAVKVMVVLEDKKLLSKGFVQKLFDYYHAIPNYSCKYAFLSDFQNVCNSNGVSSQFIDFGIYGPKMLFVTEQYAPVHKGTYYKDESKIHHYARLFDETWNSDFITKANPSSNTTLVALADFRYPGGDGVE
jgi:hypothetical protein